MEKSDAELKWKAYIEYVERCEKRKWVPAAPTQELLDLVGKKVEEIQIIIPKKKKKKKKP